MARKYIVGFSESAIEDVQLTIVNAENPEHALDKFAVGIGIKEPKFIEYVYDRPVIWLATDEEIEEYDETGVLTIDDEELKRRVKEFFGENTDYAQAYLDYYYSDQKASEDTFPKDMLLYIWFESDWAADVLVAPLDELPVIE